MRISSWRDFRSAWAVAVEDILEVFGGVRVYDDVCDCCGRQIRLVRESDIVFLKYRKDHGFKMVKRIWLNFV